MFPLRSGPTTSRPGTTRIATATSINKPCRLIPFVYSNGAAYVLLFSDKALSIYKDGVLQVVDGGTGTTVTTPYAAADLGRLKYAQLGAVLTICHPSYVPQDLELNSNGTWGVTVATPTPHQELSPVSFNALEFVDYSYGAGGDFGLSAPVIMPYKAALANNDVNNPIPGVDFFPPDDTHPAAPWAWGVTAVAQLLDGSIIETTLAPVTKIARCVQGLVPSSTKTSIWNPLSRYPVGSVVSTDYVTGSFWVSLLDTDPVGNLGNNPDDPTTHGYWWGLGDNLSSVVPLGGFVYMSDDLPFLNYVVLAPDKPIRLVWASESSNPNYKVLFWKVYRCQSAGLGGTVTSNVATSQQQWGWIGDSTQPVLAPAPWAATVTYTFGQVINYARPLTGTTWGQYIQYSTNDLVASSGIIYVAIQASYGIVVTNTAYWKPVSVWDNSTYYLTGSHVVETVSGANVVYIALSENNGMLPSEHPEFWSKVVLPSELYYCLAVASVTCLNKPPWSQSGLALWRRCPYYPLQYFIDTGQAPDYTKSPPLGSNPFRVLNFDGTTKAIENPSVVTYFEQRRVFGNTKSSVTSRPGWLFGSNVGDYTNFDKAVIQTESQEFEFELASQRYEEIRGLLPVAKLLCFTNASEWYIGGANGAPLAYDDVDAKPQGDHGSSWLDPMRVGNEALFVQERGPHIQSLLFDFGSQSWDSTELNVFADHLLDGHKIVAWCWAHAPFHCVFMVRDDGVLLSMTYQREQEVNAWAWHDTVGQFLDICTVPESNTDGTVTEDAVYFLVQRGGLLADDLDHVTTASGNVYLERLNSLAPGEPITAVPELDCGDAIRSYITGELMVELPAGAHWGSLISYVVGDWVTLGANYYVALQAGADHVVTDAAYWHQFYAWDAGHTYSVGDHVYESVGGTNHVYIAIVANTGSDPSTTPTMWTEVIHYVHNGEVVALGCGDPTFRVEEADGAGGAIFVGTKDDGTSITFSVPAGGVLSVNEVIALVSGQTTLSLETETPITQWVRQQTAIDMPALSTALTLSVIAFNADGTWLLTKGTGGGSPVTVTGSNIVCVWVGLPFIQQMGQLPPAIQMQEVRTLFCSLERMTLEAIAYGQVEVGQDFDHPLQTQTLKFADTPLQATSQLIEVRPPNTWIKGAVGVIQQSLPLPLTVLTSIRKIDFQKD